MEAFEKFYADDIVMLENDLEPTIGKDANREREKEFFASLKEFRGVKVLANGVGGAASCLKMLTIYIVSL